MPAIISVGSMMGLLTFATFLLYAWREFYPDSDVAALALVALGVILFRGTFQPARNLHRAKINAALLPGSRLSGVLTGRTSAMLLSLGFAVFATLVLAWQALTATDNELLVLMALCISAGCLSIWSQTRLSKSLRAPFAVAIGTNWGYVLSGFLFMLALAWINWNYVLHPSTMYTDTLHEAINRAASEVPARDSWISEILSVFYAFEAATVWGIVHIGAPFWVTILYSLEAALVTFIVAKSATAVTNVSFDVSSVPSTPPRFLFAAPVLACLLVAWEYANTDSRPDSCSAIMESLVKAPDKARSEMEHHVDVVVAAAYGPVYAAIPEYADHHYSLWGRITNFWLALTGGNMAEKLEETLFNGFSDRLEEGGGALDSIFDARYKQIVRRISRGSCLDTTTGVVKRTRNIIQEDAISGAISTLSIAAVAAKWAGSGASTAALTNKVAKQIKDKLDGPNGKAPTKTKLLNITKALSRAVGGIGGLIAAIIGVEVDEALNREEFEGNLRKAIDIARAETKREFRAALEQKANGFTMREIARQASFGNS